MPRIGAFFRGILVFLLASLTWAGGCTGGHPAGVVIYTQTAQGVHLLLADHQPPSDRGWGGFGGKHQPGETPAQTAARECEEETRGYFRRAAILKAIGDQQPVFDGHYAQYFVQVDPVAVDAISKAPVSTQDPAYGERGPWAWIPCAEIQRLLEMDESGGPLRIDARYLPADAHTDWAWPTWLHSFRLAIDQGALPFACRPADASAAEGGKQGLSISGILAVIAPGASRPSDFLHGAKIADRPDRREDLSRRPPRIRR